MAEPAREESTRSSSGGVRRIFAKENRRLLAGLLIGALVAVFAVVNVDRVEVDWIVTTSDTPLIVVIALSFALGALVTWLATAIRRRRS